MSYQRKLTDRRRRAKKIGVRLRLDPQWRFWNLPLEQATRSDLEALASTLRFLMRNGGPDDNPQGTH